MFTQLRYFVEVVERHGFSAAAKSLGVSQPTLTRSLQTLESQLGAQLINRENRDLELTAAGDLVLMRARSLLAEQNALLRDLQAVKKRQPQSLNVNGAPITSMYLLPAIMRQLATEEPNIRVSVTGPMDSDYDRKQAAVLAGELDVALTLYDPGNATNGLAQEMLVEPEARLLARIGHPASRPDITFSELSRYPWIVQGALTRSAMEAEFTYRGLPLPDAVLEISEWQLAFQLVEVTDHVMIIPYHPALLGDKLERFVLLGPELRMRSHALAIVYRPLSVHRQATQRFINAVHEVVRQSTADAKPRDKRDMAKPRRSTMAEPRAGKKRRS